ncbi:MAG: YkgJ family cysteine cluster protein [Bryobacteraceae bacterium]
MNIVTDLVQIRRMGEQKRAENLRFRKYMKSRVFVERQFRKAAEEVHDAIDCRECAECCRVTEVQITERDAEKLMKFLGLSHREFVAKHVAEDSDGNPILKRVKASEKGPEACEFLIGNECSVYEARPANCERFPHILRGAGSLESRMWDLVDRATYCPIVYNWLETVKGLTKFKP